MPAPSRIPVRDAATRLGVSPQTIRNWLRRNRLKGRMQGRTWLVDTKSIEALEPRISRHAGNATQPSDIEHDSAQLAETVNRLVQREAAAERLLESIERERDRFRAEAAASKEAALRAIASSVEAQKAARQLLDALELQSDALAQLVAPSSPLDVLGD